MTIAFAIGFGAFTAVYVWGESLMKPFIPSPEWPDAIVSFSPGVSSFDISRLSNIEGVRKIAEVQPFQVPFSPLEQWGGAKGGAASAAPREGRAPARPHQAPGTRHQAPFRNALLLGCDPTTAFTGQAPLLPLRLVEGDLPSAAAMLASTNACIITEMMSRVRNLHKGDSLKLDCRGLEVELPIAAVADLNWHMVTSRAKVRGLNRSPVMTDGPAFVSFDTIDEINPIPSVHVKMTHVWLNYDPAFLAVHGPLKAGQLVEASIKSALAANDCEVQLHARDEIADGTLAHGTSIIGTLARVPYIFLVVLSFGFIAQIVAAADARKREFAALRTAGATRCQISWLLVKDTLLTATHGLAWGVVLGSVAGWLFTHGTRAAMSQWGLPPCFVLPFWKVLSGALGALAVTLLVATPCAAKAQSSIE